MGKEGQIDAEGCCGKLMQKDESQKEGPQFQPRQKLPIKRCPPKPLVIRDASNPKDSCLSDLLPLPHNLSQTQPLENQKKGSEVSETTFASPATETIPNSSQNSNEDDIWLDNRPESPICYNEFLNFSEESEDSDPPYDPITEVESDGSLDLQDEFDDEFDEEEEGFNESLLGDDGGYDTEVDDEEFKTAKERVRTYSAKLVEIAEQLQREVAEGRLGSVQEGATVGTGQEGNESEYDDSDDDLLTPPNNDEDETREERKKRTGTLVKSATNFAVFTWKVGQRFASRDEFKDAVAKYAILQGRDLVFEISDQKRQQRLGVGCVPGCGFYLYGAWDSRRATFVVKRVESNHTCQRNMKRNRQLKSTWVARQFLEVFKSRPHWPAKEIIETIRRAYKVVVRRGFAYKVKYAAHKLLHGSMHDHYEKVPRYLAALKSSSPGSSLELVTVTTLKKRPLTPVFQRLFTCFEGLQNGWKEGCRRVICVDGCFLKTFLGGQLLTAVGRDGNEQMYPIAWAVAEGENNLSWEWFFGELQKCLDLGDGEGICIISDEHMAILNGVRVVLPRAEHRHCARHVFALWHRTYKGDDLKLLFWTIAKAYNLADYNDALEKLENLNPDAATAFKAYNPKLFCRAFLDTSVKSDAITSNMAETFNGYIINARTKHLIYMLEEIRAALMQRLVQKRIEMQKCTSILCPNIQKKLEKEKDKAANCDVMPSTESLFNVSYHLDQLIVNLETRTCTCRKWDMTGIPCCHAVACIFFLHQNAEDYVDKWYRKDVYMKAYAGSIPPCEGERHWPRVNCSIEPPPIKIGPGRPRKNRIKDPHENPKKPGTLTRVGMEMTCSVCKVKGHNKRRCPNKATATASEPPPKRAKGRPRNDGEGSASASEPPTQTSTVQQHHLATAQPTQLGRGGRMIRGGPGSRGGRGSTASVGESTASGQEGRGRGRGRWKRQR